MNAHPSANGSHGPMTQPVADRPATPRWSDRLPAGWRSWRPRHGPAWRTLLTLAGVGLVCVVVWAIVPSSTHREGARSAVDGSDQVAANGVVEGASRERSLAPEVAGTLQAVHVQVNQGVPAGALLFELVNNSQRAQVAVAAAQLKVAEAQHEQAKTDCRRSQQIQRQHAGAISEQAVDADRCRLQVAQAKLEEARAQLQLAEAELAKTQVRAPVAGQVLQIHKEAGAQVGPALGRGGPGEPLLRLADVSRRRVRAFVEELDVGRVAVGQRAVATADGFPGREYAGRVVELAGRMGKDAPESDAPGEYKDVYYREVVVELDGGLELPLNLRVQVKIMAEPASQTTRNAVMSGSFPND